RPLVIVPRATHKIEQQIRAETLASHGLAQCVHPRDAGPETLAAALEWALGRDRKAHARLVRAVIPAFDGATRLTAYLGRWLGDWCASGSSPGRTRTASPCPCAICRRSGCSSSRGWRGRSCPGS